MNENMLLLFFGWEINAEDWRINEAPLEVWGQILLGAGATL